MYGESKLEFIRNAFRMYEVNTKVPLFAKSKYKIPRVTINTPYPKNVKHAFIQYTR